MLKLPKVFFLALALFLFLGFFWDKPEKEENQNYQKITASVDEAEVETGEIFYYTITIEGDFSKPQIKEPCLEKFKIVSRQQSRSISRQKGKTRLKIEFTYLLLSTQPGTFKIQPVKVIDGQEIYESETIKVNVFGEPLEKKRKLQPCLGEATDI